MADGDERLGLAFDIALPDRHVEVREARFVRRCVGDNLATFTCDSTSACRNLPMEFKVVFDAAS